MGKPPARRVCGGAGAIRRARPWKGRSSPGRSVRDAVRGVKRAFFLVSENRGSHSRGPWSEWVSEIGEPAAIGGSSGLREIRGSSEVSGYSDFSAKHRRAPALSAEPDPGREGTYPAPVAGCRLRRQMAFFLVTASEVGSVRVRETGRSR